MENLKQMIRDVNMELIETGSKGGVGIMGSITAMTINDLAGLIVAFLTGVYMVLQIRDNLHKRKSLKEIKDKKE